MRILVFTDIDYIFVKIYRQPIIEPILTLRDMACNARILVCLHMYTH